MEHDVEMASLKNGDEKNADLLKGFEAPEGLVPVAVFGDFSGAGDAGLAVLAMGKAYWTLLHEGTYVICVAEPDEVVVRKELETVALLSKRKRNLSPSRYVEFSFGYLSFGLYAVLLIACFVWQQGGQIQDLGRIDAVRMLEANEWARAVTALTLHGDVVHLVSNLVAGMGFAFFVARFFGAASGWLLILISGILGNALNAWVYYPQDHFAIGASTAVFGALGLLTGVGLWLALTEGEHAWAMPRWLMPIFGGLTLLGLIGVGDGLVDVAAHISGFLCGIALGVFGALFQRVFVSWQIQRLWIGLVSLALVALAWASRL
jgi:membrane associated rhomboid family serine protease